MSNPLEHLDDQYEVISRMHEGGMGAIYKVRHRFLDQVRVVKVLHSRLREEGEFQERFQREARLATKVRHPNIAEVYDFSVKKGTAFLIMEFIEGVNFGQLLESGGPPKIETTLEICIQALKALEHIHERNLVHRDISPDNLMLTKDDLGRPLVKLIDLGIVKPLAEDTALTKTGLFMGKLHYASPEQFGQTEDGVSLDQRSDLYSFGIVLYQLLTGGVPYEGTESAVIAGHLFHPPKDFERSDPDHRIPNPLRGIVLRALEKKPDDRFQTAQEFSAALSALLEGKEPPPPARQGAGSLDVTEIAPSTESAKHTDALLAGAERLAQLEQFDEARAQLETLLALDPRHTKAQQLLRRVCDTQLAPLLGEASRLLISESFEEAVERLNKAVAIDPKNESVIRLLTDAKAGLHARHESEELEERLARLETEVAEALEANEPEAAEAKLDAAGVELGTRAAYQELRAKVIEAKETKIAGRVAELREVAAKASESGNPDKAIQALEEALTVSPDHSGVLADLTRARQLLFEQREREKADAVVKSLIDIQAALEASAFSTARELLEEARSVRVADPTVGKQLEALQTRLDGELERQRLEARHQGKIEALVESQELEEAREALDAARQAVGRSTAFAELASKIERLRREKQQSDLAEARERIEELLRQDDFSGARVELSEAVMRFPDAPDLQQLTERIESAEEASSAAAQSEAASLADTGQFGKAADRLRESLQLHPSDPEIKALLERVEETLAEQEEEAAIEEQVAVLLSEAETHESAGRYAEAERALASAQELQPDNLKLEELRTRIQTLAERQQQKTRVGSLAEAHKAATEQRIAEAASETQPAAAASAADVEPAVDAVVADSKSRSPMARWPIFVGVGIAGLIAVVAVVWFLLKGVEEPVVDDTAAAQPEAAPTAMVEESLVLDAVPWAEIVSIVDAEGQPVDIDDSPYTPIVVQLAPGTYTIGMRHPSAPEVRFEEVEVLAGRKGRLSVVFDEVNLDDYFQAVGWSQ